MVQAIVMAETGGPDVLTLQDIPKPTPAHGEVLLRHTAIGLNYIDIYHRSGLYPVPALPAILGLEGAGVVEALGDGVHGFHVGDRVAYAAPPLGAYCTHRVMPASRLVQLPDWIDDEHAAAMMLQGMTAHYLLRRTYPVGPNHTILVHAAAGGVGLILCQWARHLGARVIGTVGSPEKAELAQAHGCTHPILYKDTDFVAAVSRLTEGKGVDVVYDSVGKDTFLRSLDCLRPLGMMVSFGQSSGPIASFDPALLAQKGSLFLTRPTLFTYTAQRADLMEAAAELFEMLHHGAVSIEVRQRFPLAEAATAHRALEARETVGSSILVP